MSVIKNILILLVSSLFVLIIQKYIIQTQLHFDIEYKNDYVVLGDIIKDKDLAMTEQNEFIYIDISKIDNISNRGGNKFRYSKKLDGFTLVSQKLIDKNIDLLKRKIFSYKKSLIESVIQNKTNHLTNEMINKNKLEIQKIEKEIKLTENFDNLKVVIELEDSFLNKVITFFNFEDLKNYYLNKVKFLEKEIEYTNKIKNELTNFDQININNENISIDFIKYNYINLFTIILIFIVNSIGTYFLIFVLISKRKNKNY